MQISSYFKKKINNTFIKNILTLLTGSVIGQVIVFLAIPFLTRLFSTEIFGVYILYSSSVILLKTLATLNYELAILLPKKDKDAINIFVLNLLIIFLFSLFLFLTIFIFHDIIISILNIQRISFFVYYIPLSVFLMGNITAFDYWNNRANMFKNISIGVISKSASMSAFQIITGISVFKSIGLVPGMILGQVINVILIAKLSAKKISSLKRHISIKRILFLALKYKDIPLFNTLINFSNTLSRELPVLFITKFFGLGEAGLYGLAIKVSKAPPGIIRQSVSQAFFNEASKLHHIGGNMILLLMRTLKNLLITALFIFIPLFIISFYLGFIFGEEWTKVGTYVRILIPWLFIMFLSAPVSSLTIILNKQKIFLYYDLTLLISRFLALYIGYSIYHSITVSLLLFSAVGVIFGIIWILFFIKISKQTKHKKRNVYD